MHRLEERLGLLDLGGLEREGRIMAKGEFFKGVAADELPKIGMEQFSKIASSRARRSLKRGFSDSEKKLLAKIRKTIEGKYNKILKTHCRRMIILPEMMGLVIHVHNGKQFVPVRVVYDMVGRYLGEFSQTRVGVKHSAPGIGATKSSAAASVK